MLDAMQQATLFPSLEDIMLAIMVFLLDGSSFFLETRSEKLQFETQYGILSVPLEKVWRVEFGVHSDKQEEVKRKLSLLGNEEYKVRDKATKWLKDHSRDAFPLLSVFVPEDLESKKRVKGLLEGYHLYPRIKDLIEVQDGQLEGIIKNTHIKGYNSALGEVSIAVDTIGKLIVQQVTTKFRMRVGEWVSIGVIKFRTLHISAEGEIDLYPAQAGQYISNPAGRTEVHDGYPIGAVIGRMNGGTFLIGADWKLQTAGTGPIELRIVPSEWQARPVGDYLITVEVNK